MRVASPQPPMPTVKLVLYLFLLAAAIALAMFSVHRRLVNNDMKTEMIISVMTTLLIISSVELIPELFSTLSEKSETGKFRRFFGAVAVTHDVRLVFAYRCEPQAFGSYHWKTHHLVPEVGQAKPIPEGVNAWMSFQDVRAAVYLSNLFLRFAHRNARIIHDKDLETDDFGFCAISIGLGFNGFTHRLASWCDNELFTIKFGDSIKKEFIYKTDYFSIGKEGSTPVPPLGKDDCIIARIVPVSKRGKAKRVSFVCAGRTAPGTAVAGYFLAYRWKELLQLYEDSKKELERDSLVVVIRHTADSTGTLEFDLEAQIAKEDGSSLCEWGVAAGVD